MAEEKTTKKNKSAVKKTDSPKKKVAKKTTSTKKKETSKKVPKKEVQDTKKLEDTIRIRIDEDRVNDVDSLDTSFIEGKKRKKIKENKKAKEKILTEKKDYSNFFNVIKYIIYVLAACCIIFLGILAIRNGKFFETKLKSNDDTLEKDDKKEEVKEKIVLPDNYLFVGDFSTKNMDFEDFVYPYVKVSDDDYTTVDLLNNIDQDIYIYNPSTVFIELGINDLNNEVAMEDIISNFEEIINGIKSNRPYAEIYIESVYPIGDELGEESIISNRVTNKKIRNLNKKIEKLTKDLEVNYIDMYTELSYEKSLKDKYSEDGVNLNEDGYNRVFKVINRIIEENEETE